jgi:hypothetical protein
MALVMCEAKSVVPSLGQPSDTTWAPGISFSMTIRTWSKALRP